MIGEQFDLCVYILLQDTQLSRRELALDQGQLLALILAGLPGTFEGITRSPETASRDCGIVPIVNCDCVIVSSPWHGHLSRTVWH